MMLIEIKIPQMGEGIIEATIIKWHVKVGDKVKADDVLCDIATDKVDSEITSPEDGTVKEILFEEGSVVGVGKTILKLESLKTVGEEVVYTTASGNPEFNTFATLHPKDLSATVEEKTEYTRMQLSPLVKQILLQHKISNDELQNIKGSGIDGRITKEDVLQYIENRSTFKKEEIKITNIEPEKEQIYTITNEDTVIEMDRVRKLIAEHMIRSKQTSAHVTSFVEADVSRIVLWREKNKENFKNKFNINLTFLPVFIQVLSKTLLKYPMLNSTIDGNRIILKKNINIGIATALPNDNLIVPVLKNVDQLSLIGIIKGIHDLVTRARENKLLPNEITGGTFSVTNLGTFGTLAGTPIINQPQVAILGIGTIRKVPSVIETNEGDVIAIRSKVILSLSFDHRIIDGMMAGKFLKDYSNAIQNITIDEL
jgi:2-oxoglutarate dehydrogenase E2 component (dihydrolipoamide succinyltransferase)